MSKNKKIKSVGFNVTNEKDQLILNAIKRRNFSAYVKKLLWDDLTTNGKIKPYSENDRPIREEVKKKASAADELKAMKQKKRSNGSTVKPPFMPNLTNKGINS